MRCRLMANKSIWKQANMQAAHIPQIKDRRAKERQIVLLCETLKKAMKGDK